jgi:diacylglycerol kinase (ATP)
VHRTITLLVNPTAGSGKGARFGAQARDRFELSGRTVHHRTSRDVDDAALIAAEAVADPASDLVVCGGDGLVNLALQALAQSRRPLGIIPAGTGNDVARYFGIPRSDAARAAEVVLGGKTRTIDLARSSGRYFATVMAAGFDAKVNERANRMSWPSGQMRYNLATVAELRVFHPIPYVLDLDGRIVELEAMTVAIGNGPSFGGGLRITEGASLNDGLLDVVLFRRMSKLGLVRAYPRLFNGTHVRLPQYERHQVRRVTVSAPGITAYADGERFGPLPLTVEAVADALEVWVP